MHILTTLLYGALAAAAALITEMFVLTLIAMPYGSTNIATAIPFAFLPIAAFLEESSKLLFLRRALETSTGISGQVSRLTSLGIAFGLGFAAVELAITSTTFTGAENIASWSGLIFIHVATSVLFVKFLPPNESRRSRFIAILALAVFLHTAYNLIILTW